MQKLFYNGDIITLEDDHVEAVLVEGSRIKRTGTLKALQADVHEDCEHIDLKGKCLLPSFIDAHSHISQFAITLNLVVLSEVSSIDEIQERIRNFKKQHQLDDDAWIIGFGYDHNFLKEHRHPTAKELDEAAPNPMLLAHASGHMGVANTVALQSFQIHEDVQDPEGGKYGRDKDGKLTGYLEENAFMKHAGAIQKPSMEQLIQQMKEAQHIYASYGITTAQEGIMKSDEFALLKMMAQQGALCLDIVGYADMKDHSKILETYKEYVGNYKQKLKIGGYKIFLDGSPQGRTAWLSEPYEGSEDYCGYPIYKDEEVQSFVDKALREEVQLLTHCNGDASAEQLLRAFEKADIHQDTRPVMIHAQTLRVDQMPRLKKLHMIPSFFMAHTYYWGDIHIENLGRKRANAISPARTALEEGIPFTFHQDTPVLAPNMLETIWCAVNRKTRKNEVLEGQQIPVLEAIKAVTKYAAYQYFEEHEKGSIQEGKLADLVILDKNPCLVDAGEIKDIQVLQTIKEGNTIFKKEVGY